MQPGRLVAIVWSGTAATTLALAVILSRRSEALPPCGLRETIGVPCPTCGTLRGLALLFDGNVGKAFLENPFVLAGLLAFWAGGVLAPVAWRLGRPLRVSARRRNVALLAAAFLSNWVYLVLRAR